ncbi:hypothetical protein EDB86DRAFT_2868529, partial [Lactarius hatsudake]
MRKSMMPLLVASIRTGTADAHITQTIPIPKAFSDRQDYCTQLHQRGRPYMLVTYISPAERLPRCYLCYASSSRLPFCLLWWNGRPFPVRQAHYVHRWGGPVVETYYHRHNHSTECHVAASHPRQSPSHVLWCDFSDGFTSFYI